MHSIRPYCLSIAGYDPSGGAGVLSDVKTFESHKVYGFAVTTGITFQNDATFLGVNWHAVAEIEKQILPLKKFPVKYVKIGLVKSFENIGLIIDIVKEVFPESYIVWDPILKASAGFEFHDGKAIDTELLNRVDLITPNYNEFQLLGFDKNIPKNTTVLLKGGHRTENAGVDTLLYAGKRIDIEGESFNQKVDKHGTGCVLSSAITACLAKGEDLETACRNAKAYVEQFILSNNTGLGFHS